MIRRLVAVGGGCYFGVVNSGDRANILTKHAGDIAGPIHGNGIKRADKGLGLRTNSHAGTAIYAGIPSNIK
jgi:hypothetical protein